MTTHPSILAWGNPMDRGAWQATVCRVVKQLDITYWLNNNNNILTMVDRVKAALQISGGKT